mmetsp:Transcript_79110/g.224206  ORF Transcript_79110/g.224206 Transcript_79110/m.224206 type:complete len:294 (-) Transcript_79110:181-1062(-)
MLQPGLLVLLPVLHPLQLALLCACERRRRRGAIRQEAVGPEDALVAHGLDHVVEILGGPALDVTDLLPTLPDVVEHGLSDVLVEILSHLLQLLECLQGLVRAPQALERLGLPEKRLLVVLLEREGGFRGPQGALPLVHLQGGVRLIVQAGAVHRLQLPVLLLQVRLGPEVLEHLVPLAVAGQRALPVLVGERLVALSLDLLPEVQHALHLPLVQHLLAVGRLAVHAADDAITLHDHPVHEVFFDLLLGLPAGDAVRARGDLGLDRHQAMVHLRLPQLVAKYQPVLPRLAQALP